MTAEVSASRVSPPPAMITTRLPEDLHKLISQLKLRDATLVGFSMGAGEVARYLGKYGSRVRAVIISGVTHICEDGR